MAKSNEVTNNHNGPLGVGGVVIPAKSFVEVPNWEKVSQNGVVRRWLDSGVLSVGKSSAKKVADGPDESAPDVVENVQFTEQANHPDQSQEGDEDAEKDSLIARLKELDIKADKRSSVEKLREKLEEALAK